MATTNGNLKVRWVLNFAITCIGALVLVVIGWLKSDLDVTNARLNEVARDEHTIEGKADSVNARLDYLEESLKANTQEQGEMRNRIDQIQHETDINQDWIAAQANANNALRRLGKKP